MRSFSRRTYVCKASAVMVRDSSISRPPRHQRISRSKLWSDIHTPTELDRRHTNLCSALTCTCLCHDHCMKVMHYCTEPDFACRALLQLYGLLRPWPNNHDCMPCLLTLQHNTTQCMFTRYYDILLGVPSAFYKLTRANLGASAQLTQCCTAHREPTVYTTTAPPCTCIYDRMLAHLLLCSLTLL